MRRQISTNVVNNILSVKQLFVKNQRNFFRFPLMKFLSEMNDREELPRNVDYIEFRLSITIQRQLCTQQYAIRCRLSNTNLSLTHISLHDHYGSVIFFTEASKLNSMRKTEGCQIALNTVGDSNGKTWTFVVASNNANNQPRETSMYASDCRCESSQVISIRRDGPFRRTSGYPYTPSKYNSCIRITCRKLKKIIAR